MVKEVESPPPLPQVRAFNCPKCGSTVAHRAQGVSLVAACSSCGSVIETLNETFRILQQSQTQARRKQVIPLGTRGKLHGSVWEVIGYMERKDVASLYRWSEYLLYNPTKGFRWLAENNGHWSYILMTKVKATRSVTNGSAFYAGKYYKVFHAGRAQIDYIVGEFYWRAKVGETVSVEDYILDHEILSLESKNDEVIWSIGEYVQPQDIRRAFKVEEMPVPMGVAPNQPSPHKDAVQGLAKTWAFFVVVLFFLQLLTMMFSENRVVYEDQFAHSSLGGGSVRISGPFSMKNETANVMISLVAPVNNSWLHVEGELVNDDTGVTDAFDLGVEYYSGRDSDGHWTEGSRVGHKILSRIGGGNYHLNLRSSSDMRATDYKIRVTRDVVLFGNFLWSFGLLSIFPLFMLWRRRSFEVQRWADSDFSPYAVHEYGDEE